MNNLLATMISQSRAVISTLVFLLVVGAITYAQIPKESEPEVNIPIIVVSITLEGISPADAERLLVRPLEEELSNLEGLKELRATAFQGGVSVNIEFDADTDLDVMLQELRNKIDIARPEMPADINEPIINEVRVSLFPMSIMAISGDLPERTLFNYARELKDELMTLPGVFKVEMTGSREEMVEIVVEPARVQSYRLNSDDLMRVFSRANRLVAAGRIDIGHGSFAVSVPGLFESVDDILMMPVKVSGNAIIRVRDIADIKRTFKDAESIVRVNGQPAIALEIIKRYGFNIIQTTEAVGRAASRISTGWPSAVKTEMIWDGTIGVKEQFYMMQNSVILAVFLVMAIVIGALGVRSGLLVGVAIPGSFLTGLMFLYLFNVTLNVAVMFGLLIAVGMLVDGAIVVVEYADRKMAEGIDRRHAYILATQRMAWPIISSTATTVVAFVPLVLWPGMPGQMLGYLPKTLIAVLTCSLFMALIFVPTLGTLIGRVSAGTHESIKAVSGADRFHLERLTGAARLYVQALQKALCHPAKVVVGTVVLLIVAIFLYIRADNGLTFFSEQDPPRAKILIHAPGNLGIEEKMALTKEVERRLVGIDDIDNIYSRVGVSGPGISDDVIGAITLNFKEWGERRPGSEVVLDISERTRSIAGMRAEIEVDASGPVQGKAIQIELSAIVPQALLDGLLHIRRAMDELGGFVNTEDSRPIRGIEWRLYVDRPQAARFGADLTAVGSAVRMITNGVKLGSYRPDDSEDEIDIFVRFPKKYRSFRQLDELRIETNKGLVPISNFVRRVPVQQKPDLLRVDRRSTMTIKSDVAPDLLPNNQVVALQAWLADNPLDPQVRISFRGEAEQQQESGNFLIIAFAFALFMMAAILLVQFNNFYSVLLILSSVILSTIGVLLGYIIFQEPFIVVMTGVGLIALAGIVVNNNIVLIDTYDRLIKTAPNAFEAILQTGVQRLRPVFLTTATTAFGLLPIAMGISIDFFSREIAFRAPATIFWQMLAFTIIAGLIFSTVLTLIVTPCALMLRDRRRKQSVTGRPSIQSQQPAE